MASDPIITVTDDPDEHDVKALIAGLVAYNDGAAERQNPRPLAIFAKAGGRVVGGANAVTQWQWLFINHVWVHEDYRKTGLGRRIIRDIEAAAVARGCVGSHLDTFSFQALGFYEKLGYARMGTIADYPPGHARHYLYKRLITEPGVEP